MINYKQFINVSVIDILVLFLSIGHETGKLIMSDAGATALTSVLLILVIVDIVGNSLVCSIIKRNRDMRSVPTLWVRSFRMIRNTGSLCIKGAGESLLRVDLPDPTDVWSE